MGDSHAPLPPYHRMMIFIDGENLVFRYQEMLKLGYVPHADVVHEPDVFVWREVQPFYPYMHFVLRATYYTYATGSEEFLFSITEKIKALRYRQPPRITLPNTLYPQVFRKMRREVKGKGVDIQMTVDILTHVFNDNVDAVYLLSGDGDNKPVIKSVIRSGKQIFLAAFSSGLNASLANLADKFTLLDSHYFQLDPKGNKVQE
jgi:uncharacterized LabA/DUF88 family protein